MSASLPKKQHYVPASYLAGFTHPSKQNQLWVYSKQGDKVRPSTPENEGHQRYTYAVQKADGTIDKASVEKSLSPLDQQGAELNVYYLQDRLSGKIKRWNLQTDSLQLAREKLRQYESARFERLDLVAQAPQARHVEPPLRGHFLRRLQRELVPSFRFGEVFVDEWGEGLAFRLIAAVLHRLELFGFRQHRLLAVLLSSCLGILHRKVPAGIFGSPSRLPELLFGLFDSFVPALRLFALLHEAAVALEGFLVRLAIRLAAGGPEIVPLAVDLLAPPPAPGVAVRFPGQFCHALHRRVMRSPNAGSRYTSGLAGSIPTWRPAVRGQEGGQVLGPTSEAGKASFKYLISLNLKRSRVDSNHRPAV
ncbi:MAG: DUF4238 domain-containing protein [Phycisphaeraceae bacterium]